MAPLLAIASYTVKQHARNRVFLVIFMFGLMLLSGSVVASALADEERLRVIFDLGLAGIEFICLLAAVFVTSSLILEEVESRSIYLLLSRPLPRWQYLVGRYLGTMAALAIGMAAMAVLHLAALLTQGWAWQGWLYAGALSCCFLKIAVVAALALMLSLATTSAASAMAFTLFLWVLGHFSDEMRYLAERSGQPLVKAVVFAARIVAPDFSYFNFRDFWETSRPVPRAFFGWLGAYSAAYTSVVMSLSSWLFSNREL